MEFDKSKVYTAANADSLRTGSMGYHADNLEALKRRVSSEVNEEDKKMTEERNNIFEKLEKESFELFTKLQKLAVFIGSERYKKLFLFHRYLLRRQLYFMRKYHQILTLRQKEIDKLTRSEK